MSNQPVLSPPSVRLFSSHSSQNTPNPSFNLPSKALAFPSISLKPYTATKARALVITSPVIRRVIEEHSGECSLTQEVVARALLLRQGWGGR
ncbi:hypothetical protein ACFX2I_032841 [Malus domestica]